MAYRENEVPEWLSHLQVVKEITFQATASLQNKPASKLVNFQVQPHILQWALEPTKYNLPSHSIYTFFLKKEILNLTQLHKINL